MYVTPASALITTAAAVAAADDNNNNNSNKEKTCLQIDTGTPYDSNVNTREADKLSKYKDLEVEVSKILKVRTKFLAVINGALGIIRKGLYQNLQFLPGHSSATELQKVTLISIAHSIDKAWGKSL